MRVGLVGNGSNKFTSIGEQRARHAIRAALGHSTVMVSGHSPVGGIDIWAEEEAEKLGIALDLKVPEIHQWNPTGYGYKARNQDIAASSDVLYVILADSYPEDYSGMRFDLCYHCARMGRDPKDHVKSGGCWTGKYALTLDVPTTWVIVPNGG